MAERAERARFSLATITGAAPALPLMLLLAIAAVDGLDTAMFGALLPEIRDWFGVSLATALGLQSLAALLVILAAIPVGYLCDRTNRVRLTVIAGIAWGVMSFATGLAPTLLFLYLARFGSGLTQAVGPAHNSLVADWYPPESRTGVYSMFGAAKPLGAFFGPLVGGYLAARLTWQVPFLLFGLPSMVIALVIAVRVKEPVRGGQERKAMGLEHVEPPPPSFSEGWRIARSVRTLRRIWWSMPFLVGGYIALLNFLGVFFDQTFHLGTAARGDIVAANQPFLLAGLAVGAIGGNRLLRIRPSRLVTYTGLIGVAQALSIGLVAIAPTWWVALMPLYLGTAVGAILQPSLYALLSLVIPPRVRGGALGFAGLFAAPGLIIAPLMGQVADSIGARWGIAVSIPFFLIGSVIVASAGVSIDADIRQARAAAAAAGAAALRVAGRPMLVVRDLDVHFGGVQILFGVDLDVAEGEILALLGTNGAGKSTLLRAIAGTVTPSSGAIFLDGTDVTFLPASAHAGRGVAQVQGGKGVFPNLSVAENVRLAAWGMEADAADVDAALELFPVLRQRAGQIAANLSGGEQQMLALAQAFMARPRLLVIDELSLGLAPSVVGQLLDVVRRIHEQGATVIVVEQSITTALSIAERAVFMEKGEVRFTGPTRDLLDRPDVLRSVFLAGGARAVTGSYGTRRPEATEPGAALEVRGLHKTYGGVTATDDVSFTIARGEILGMIGPNGAGKTTIFDLVSGFETPDAGAVILGGVDVTALPADQRARLGLHRSFQDARLFPSLTVFEAICVALERHVDVRSPFPAAFHLPNVRRAERRTAARAERLIDLLGLGPHRDKFLRDLSTGTRRLVDLASVVATEPKVLLLDEPAAGIAQRETEQLGPIIERIRFEVGCAILVIEHDLPLISAVSDELIALEQGAVVTRGSPAAVLDDPRVVAAYVGTTS